MGGERGPPGPADHQRSRGSYQPDWHLLVGDESALPAIMAALVDLPEETVVRVVVLVESGEDEPRLEMPSGGEVTFVHRSEVGPEGGLESAVRALSWLPGRVHAFVHGEAHEASAYGRICSVSGSCSASRCRFRAIGAAAGTKRVCARGRPNSPAVKEPP